MVAWVWCYVRDPQLCLLYYNFNNIYFHSSETKFKILHKHFTADIVENDEQSKNSWLPFQQFFGETFNFDSFLSKTESVSKFTVFDIFITQWIKVFVNSLLTLGCDAS